jgi:hypothetical protein
MRESRLSGSVEGVMRNRDPYSDCIDVHIGFLSGVLRLMLRARGDESL